MDVGLAQAASGRNVWIQAGGGAWSGLDLFDSQATSLDGILAGDSIEVTGMVDEFNHETELVSISAVNLISAGNTVHSTVVNLGDLNNNSQVNQVPTGEQWEGVFVELENVTVTSITYFSNNTRVSFQVADANGNKINVSDRFLAGRLPAMGGAFVPPVVGTVYCSLKGVIIHSPNGCFGSNGRGYELHPFDAAHYTPCPGGAYPQISNIVHTPVAPTSSQAVTVTATISDADGTITSAYLKYAVGVSNSNYTTVAMTGVSGGTYTGTIPAQVNGSFVKYYIVAGDNDAHVSEMPTVSTGASNPLAYVVKDNGLDIYDLQYTPWTDGNSIYNFKDVTVTGVVTASAEPGNLGYIFIQQEGGLLGWGGIMCLGNSQLATLKVGDKVTVSGTVKEDFGFTRLENITSISLLSSNNTINPVEVEPGVFSTYSFANNEPFEGMLIRLKNPAGKLFVINNNADAPSNFAEYRVGKDALLPDDGCRILAGRQTSSAFSSLNVSYVNDSSWMTNGGVMNVDPIIVKYGDCMETVTGIVYYGFSNMKLLPRNNADFVSYWTACVNSVDNGLAANSIVKAYPSPASDKLNLSYEFPYNLKATVKLADIMGRTVLSQNIEGIKGETELNTQNLTNGTYLLQIHTEDAQVYSAKVMILK